MNTTKVFNMSIGLEKSGMYGRDIRRGGPAKWAMNTYTLLAWGSSKFAGGSQSKIEALGTKGEGVEEEDTTKDAKIGAVGSSPSFYKWLAQRPEPSFNAYTRTQGGFFGSES